MKEAKKRCQPRRCQPCGIHVTYGNWRRHQKTKGHLEALAPSRKLSDDQRVNAFLRGSSSTPYHHIVTKFEELYEESQGKSDRDFLYDAKECWDKKPVSGDHLIQNMIRNFDEKSTPIYSRYKSTPDDKPMIATVIRQIYQPEDCDAKVVFNIPVDATVKPPERSGEHYKQTSKGTTANLTPAGAYVKPHIDNGEYSITVIVPLGSGAVKIWVFFPPTERNLRVHEQSYQGIDRFLNPEGDFYYEKGQVVIQTHKDAVRVKPGWIHATFTVSSCAAVGIQCVSMECLEFTGKILHMDSQYLHKVSPVPFFASLTLAVLAGRTDEAAQKLCETLSELDSEYKRQMPDPPKEIENLPCFRSRKWRTVRCKTRHGVDQ